jgi:predicted secreted protein
VLAASALLAVALVACSDDSPSSSASSSSPTSGSSRAAKPATYTVADTDISVSVDQEFIIELPATPSTGYAWTAVADPKLKQEATEQVPGGARPGAQGTQRITFRAEAAGETTLVLHYARSFEPDVPPAQTASFSVTIDAG